MKMEGRKKNTEEREYRGGVIVVDVMNHQVRFLEVCLVGGALRIKTC